MKDDWILLKSNEIADSKRAVGARRCVVGEVD